jgi:nucleoid DNA-binding protein
LNRAKLIEKIADEYSMTKQDTRAWFDAIFDVLGRTIIEEDVIIYGFGTFKHKSRAPRVGRDINKGVPVYIPARTSVQFELSDKLLEELREFTKNKAEETQE